VAGFFADVGVAGATEAAGVGVAKGSVVVAAAGEIEVVSGTEGTELVEITEVIAM
jgi:hypothetical protein